MGSLTLHSIEKTGDVREKFLFSDLYLDLQEDFKAVGNFSKAETSMADIKVAYDTEAIRNSLNALFNTNPGQRLLLPEYGINLRRYIFSPVSRSRAYAIGNDLLLGIERWEPRVDVKNISVKPVIADARYDIMLDLFIPSLGKRVGYLGKLVQNEGISFV